MIDTNTLKSYRLCQRIGLVGFLGASQKNPQSFGSFVIPAKTWFCAGHWLSGFFVLAVISSLCAFVVVLSAPSRLFSWRVQARRRSIPGQAAGSLLVLAPPYLLPTTPDSFPLLSTAVWSLGSGTISIPKIPFWRAFVICSSCPCSFHILSL